MHNLDSPYNNYEDEVYIGNNDSTVSKQKKEHDVDSTSSGPPDGIKWGEEFNEGESPFEVKYRNRTQILINQNHFKMY